MRSPEGQQSRAKGGLCSAWIWQHMRERRNSRPPLSIPGNSEQFRKMAGLNSSCASQRNLTRLKLLGHPFEKPDREPPMSQLGRGVDGMSDAVFQRLPPDLSRD